jgi:hypothetical protein
VETLYVRAGLGAGLVAVLVTGVVLQTGVAEGIEPRLEELADHGFTESTARARAAERDLEIDRTGRSYLADLEADFKQFNVPPMSVDELRKPNEYRDLVNETKVLGAGQTATTEWMTVAVSVEKVTYVQQGAQLTAPHVVARLKNISDVPLGYFVEIRSADKGGCEVRASRQVNANALRPGETAEFPVCAGRGKAALHDLKALKLTPLGYAYLSKIPALALGYDQITARAHTPDGQYAVCSQIPAEKIGRRVRNGDLRWDDLADYFTRHNCEQFGFVDGYRRQTGDLNYLPVMKDTLNEALGIEPEPAAQGGEDEPSPSAG